MSMAPVKHQDPYITPLTGRELIIMKEDDRFKGRMTYGGIWNYIPRSQITGITLTYNEKDQCLALALNLTNGESLILRYELT